MKCLYLLLMLFISGTISAQELLGLVGGWKMDSNCELIDVTESSQANGVLVDVILTGNRDNVEQSALEFNLNTSYITFGVVDKLKLTDDKSISFWIKPVLTGSTHTGSIFNFGTGIIIRYQEQSSVPKLNIIFGNTSYLQPNLIANQWQLVTITFRKDFNSTKSKVVYYVDGIKTTEAEQDKSAHDFNNAIALIGPMDQFTLTNGFRGSLDDLKIYDRTLTDAEVQNLALPVTLEFFRARKVKEMIELSWKSQTEDNVSYFEVQKSNDGIAFQKISHVPAGKYNYIAYDAADNSSIIWYRLRITDRDGKTSYSNIVKVNVNNQELQMIKLYPNPGFKSIHLIGASGYGSITIINNAGMTVQQKQLAANNMVDISGLLPGFYHIIFYDGNKRRTSKFIKR